LVSALGNLFERGRKKRDGANRRKGKRQKALGVGS